MENKNIVVSVSIDTWKKLKIISIEQDVNITKVAKDILESRMSTKRKQTNEAAVEI